MGPSVWALASYQFGPLLQLDQLDEGLVDEFQSTVDHEILLRLLPKHEWYVPVFKCSKFINFCWTGVPLTTQSDPGTENNGVANVHTLIRHTLDPSLRRTRQHRFMRKHNNVKPESTWSLLRRDFTPGFQNIFDEGINQGFYDVNDPLEKYDSRHSDQF